MFGIRRNPQKTVCHIRGIEHYLDVGGQIKVDLTRGFLFRSTTFKGGILDCLFSSAAAEARLNCI